VKVVALVNGEGAEIAYVAVDGFWKTCQRCVRIAAQMGGMVKRARRELT
jgi:hypothetical protein